MPLPEEHGVPILFGASTTSSQLRERPVCRACGGSGVNSRGWPCVPCIDAGRVSSPSPMAGLREVVPPPPSPNQLQLFLL